MVNKNKKIARLRRAYKTRMKLKKLGAIRLVVHRTARHIYAQIISSIDAKTIVCASTLEKNVKKNLVYTGNKVGASEIGKLIAERALSKGIKEVSFDRSGFKYHGRIKNLANSAREFGLYF
ncbi:50S ribosomal protein L18 [Buchnera aphidicola (Formosaphis micheliae)]|uniref:50S ribosomal protein L18 n=1 Tax=Buchnera aphidicola TaxID=9 RepID=UPI0031B85AC9